MTDQLPFPASHRLKVSYAPYCSREGEDTDTHFETLFRALEYVQRSPAPTTNSPANSTVTSVADRGSLVVHVVEFGERQTAGVVDGGPIAGDAGRDTGVIVTEYNTDHPH